MSCINCFPRADKVIHKVQTEDVVHSISTLPNLGFPRRAELSEILEKIDYEIPYLRQGLVFKEDWEPDTEYQKNEVVFFQGASYVSLVNKNTQSPDKGTWTVLSEKGNIGEKGWTPIFGYQEISSIKIVAKLLDYEGGEGDKPVEYLGYYISENGYTDEVDLATNFKSVIEDASNIPYNSQYPTVKDALDALTYIPLTVSFGSGSNHEIGETVNPNLTWSYNKVIISQSLNQGIGNIGVDIRNYSPTPISLDTTYTLTGSDGTNTVSASRNYRFYSAIFSGPVDSVPTTSSQVRGLTKTLRTGSTVIDMQTGTVRKDFAIAVPYANTLVSVIDTANANVNITSAFQLLYDNFQVLDPSNTSRRYKLYVMQNAVPYSSNNILKITV